MATRNDFISACSARNTESVEFENQTLSVGREFLPQCAVDVLDGAEATPAYWDFLISQLDG